MKKYIFYTSDGFTTNRHGVESDNCQVLGWGVGLDGATAFRAFRQEANIDEGLYEIVWAEEVTGEATVLQ